jgi:hypothetical protein
MGADPFAAATLASLGSQMAQAWQTGLESWWKALLADPGRLADLAARLGLSGQGQAADPSQILTALELMERRLADLEGQVHSLAQNLALMVSHLQAGQSAGPDGAR